MSFALACWSFLLAIATVASGSPERAVTPPTQPSAFRGVASFEPPRSVGTPIDEIARNYTGVGLGDRIAGRLRLDTDASLNPVTRELIRRHLAQGN